MKTDKQSINLLKCIADGLDDSPAGFTQYFGFGIRGIEISGELKVKVEERELKPPIEPRKKK